MLPLAPIARWVGCSEDEIFLPKIELKKEVAKTSFLPHFSNKTTSAAKVYDAKSNLITSLFARSIAQWG
jgi:hypothetical protein